MNKKFFIATLSIIMATCYVSFDNANAAPRTAVRGAPVTAGARKSAVTTTQKVETPATVAEEKSEPIVEEKEEVIVLNKSSEFEVAMSNVLESASEDNSFAEQIRKQRASLAAADATNSAQSAQKNALTNNSNTCDRDLRKCMQKKCGNDFTECALDGDTIFGDKLNTCRHDTTCTGEEFNLFVPEIRADRDMNVRLGSYERVISCGNNYNACIINECGKTYNKCLGKPQADAAIQKCATIAKECTESDPGLVNRFGSAIGKLRENAEKEVKRDEERMYTLRDLMRSACKGLGAMFDERTFDCIYTVNFFVGEDQKHPSASRKRYAGDTFVCMQEWFGVNATIALENAARETRAQTAASSAMLGSGVGTAAGLISSGAIGRSLETQKAKRALKKEEKAQKAEEKAAEKANKKAEKETKKAEKEEDCTNRGGTRKSGSCYCGAVIMTKTSTCENGKIKYGTAKDNKDKNLSTMGGKNSAEKPQGNKNEPAAAATPAVPTGAEQTKQQSETPEQQQARVQKENEQKKEQCEAKGKSYEYTTAGCVINPNKKKVYDEINRMKTLYTVDDKTKWKSQKWANDLVGATSQASKDFYQAYIKVYNNCGIGKLNYKVIPNGNDEEVCTKTEK